MGWVYMLLLSVISLADLPVPAQACHSAESTQHRSRADLEDLRGPSVNTGSCEVARATQSDSCFILPGARQHGIGERLQGTERAESQTGIGRECSPWLR